ncbi:MAG: methyltransferase domain-containing protein [Oscillospiraceae bacterium]|jgi:SAM-dependent methyltransferase|nr:methyltransferase domain-containing protein [Oscillospiraceae bacterium]
MNETLQQNQTSWNAIADDWFGATALPEYGCRMPTEAQLNLFGDVSGKRLLDIGCGSGHSLLYHARRGAGELWGLDISSRQLENARGLLRENGYDARLFCSPMEENPGLPQGWFDFVYSIYAIGWTVDLQATLRHAASYLRPGGAFIFSWDHPFMHCVDARDGRYVLDGGFFDGRPFTFEKGGMPMTLANRKCSDYINALAEAGFSVERMVEETDAETLRGPSEFSSAYYAPGKARLMPLSFVMKARKM